MRVLILSCGTGGGHNDAARGAAEALRAHGHTVDLMENYLSLAGQKVDRTVCHAYIDLVKAAPAVFGGVYQIGRGVSSLLHRAKINSPVSWANGKMAPYLEKLLCETHYDAILTTHLFPAETLTRMKAARMLLPFTAAIATDYTSIPFWEETNCDAYIIPALQAVKQDFVHRDIPAEKLVLLGIPAPAAFTTDFDRAALRHSLGFLPEEKIILIMGGSMGAGDLNALVHRLRARLPASTRIFVMTGSNAALFDSMSAEYTCDAAITILPHIDCAAPYMQACDLLFTKPGGLSSTEAVLSRAPTVLLDPLSPCETANRNALVSHCCAVAPAGTAARAEWGLRLLGDAAARAKMQRAQATFAPENPAELLVHYLEKCCDAGC